MIDISTLDRPDQIRLLIDLERALGMYSIITLEVQDLREQFTDQELTVPSDAILHQACKHVSRKHNEDSSHLLEWAQDVAEELAAKEQTA
jgi:hypothetical protein